MPELREVFEMTTKQMANPMWTRGGSRRSASDGPLATVELERSPSWPRSCSG